MAELMPAEVGIITSPRKLQEMGIPSSEGHDVASASDITKKQYEEQLNGLRKENFHLKLRIYLLEEKLGTGSPPAVQEPVDDTYAESESAGDSLAVATNNNDLAVKRKNLVEKKIYGELVKLRIENKKALQIIKECMKTIEQQNKEIKKIELDKELVYTHVSDSQLEKYEEILKCKDELIKDLEIKIRDWHKHFDTIQKVDAGCILEQSLALPVGLELNESMAPEEFTMDESNMDKSQSLRIEDLTLMFGHDEGCSDDNRYSAQIKALFKHFPQADVISESECWLEPDRNVSLARVGLCDTGVGLRESSTDISKFRSKRARVSYGSRSEDNKPTSEGFIEKLNHLIKRTEQLKEKNSNLNSKLNFSKEQIDELITENNELKESLMSYQSSLAGANNTLDDLRNTVDSLESGVEYVEQKLSDSEKTADRLRSERQELEAAFMATKRYLRLAADEATIELQASLERDHDQHDNLRIERELEETLEKLSDALKVNSQLETEVTRKMALDVYNKVHEGFHSEEERPTSSDQGIDSDRLSSLEQKDPVALSPRSLYEENITLKQKLAWTKATLTETMKQLNAPMLPKRSVQRAICREIH